MYNNVHEISEMLEKNRELIRTANNYNNLFSKVMNNNQILTKEKLLQLKMRNYQHISMANILNDELYTINKQLNSAMSIQSYTNQSMWDISRIIHKNRWIYYGNDAPRLSPSLTNIVYKKLSPFNKICINIPNPTKELIEGLNTLNKTFKGDIALKTFNQAYIQNVENIIHFKYITLTPTQKLFLRTEEKYIEYRNFSYDIYYALHPTTENVQSLFRDVIFAVMDLFSEEIPYLNEFQAIIIIAKIVCLINEIDRNLTSVLIKYGYMSFKR